MGPHRSRYYSVIPILGLSYAVISARLSKPQRASASLSKPSTPVRRARRNMSLRRGSVTGLIEPMTPAPKRGTGEAYAKKQAFLAFGNYTDEVAPRDVWNSVPTRRKPHITPDMSYPCLNNACSCPSRKSASRVRRCRRWPARAGRGRTDRSLAPVEIQNQDIAQHVQRACRPTRSLH